MRARDVPRHLRDEDRVLGEIAPLGIHDARARRDGVAHDPVAGLGHDHVRGPHEVLVSHPQRVAARGVDGDDVGRPRALGRVDQEADGSEVRERAGRHGGHPEPSEGNERAGPRLLKTEAPSRVHAAHPRTAGHERDRFTPREGGEIAREGQLEHQGRRAVGGRRRVRGLEQRWLARRQVAVDPVPGEVREADRGHVRFGGRLEGERGHVAENDAGPEPAQPARFLRRSRGATRRELAPAPRGALLVDDEGPLLREADVALERAEEEGTGHRIAKELLRSRGHDGERQVRCLLPHRPQHLAHARRVPVAVPGHVRDDHIGLNGFNAENAENAQRKAEQR